MDFVFVGPQRTASTWLYQVLSKHPDIALPNEVKETMFFDERFHKGIGWYRHHFEKELDRKIVGEIAPTYFDCHDAAQRIQELFGQIKIVIAVRNPVERCHSLFRHHYSKGRLPRDFDDAMEKMPRLVESGRYQKHCRVWEKIFGQQSVHYIFQEDIQKSPDIVLAEIGNFLQIDPPEIELGLNERVNTAVAPTSTKLAWLASSASSKLRNYRMHAIVEFGKKLGLKGIFRGGKPVSPMTDEQRTRLSDIYREDIEWLQERLERDLTHWMGTSPSTSNINQTLTRG